MSKYMDIVTGSQKVFPSDADVVEVVRCKDCKYCSIDFVGDYQCDSHRMEVIEEDDFCSYGKRKQEE